MADELRDAILIVDDEKDLVTLLVKELAPLGFAIYTANTAAEADEILRSKKVTMVLCDINMPQVTGLEWLSQVRARGHSTPFVFLTGFENSQNLRQALVLGAAEFLEKPYSLKELTNTVLRTLDLGRRQAGIQEKLATLAAGHERGSEFLGKIERDKRQLAMLQALPGSKKKKKDPSTG